MPAWSNVFENVWPWLNGPDEKTPVGISGVPLVTVWFVLSLLVHVTLVPFETINVAGLNRKPVTNTSFGPATAADVVGTGVVEECIMSSVNLVGFCFTIASASGSAMWDMCPAAVRTSSNDFASP